MTHGAEQLGRWLGRTKTTQRCLARRLRVTPGTVGRWLRGGVPSPERAADIELVTGGKVLASAWVVTQP